MRRAQEILTHQDYELEAAFSAAPATRAKDRPKADRIVQSRKLGEWLVFEGVITGDQLRDALAHQAEHGGKLGEILVKLGYVDADEYMAFLADTARVGTIHLTNYSIRPEDARLLPKEFAAQHEVVPLDRFGEQLTIAMVCPLNYSAIDEVESITGLQAKPVLCSRDAFRLALYCFYATDKFLRNS